MRGTDNQVVSIRVLPDLRIRQYTSVGYDRIVHEDDFIYGLKNNRLEYATGGKTLQSLA